MSNNEPSFIEPEGQYRVIINVPIRRRTREEVLKVLPFYARKYYRLMRGHGMLKSEARAMTCRYIAALEATP